MRLTPAAAARRRRLLTEVAVAYDNSHLKLRRAEAEVDAAGGFGVAPSPLIARQLVHAADRARAAAAHQRLRDRIAQAGYFSLAGGAL